MAAWKIGNIKYFAISGGGPSVLFYISEKAAGQEFYIIWRREHLKT